MFVSNSVYVKLKDVYVFLGCVCVLWGVGDDVYVGVGEVEDADMHVGVWEGESVVV